MPEELQEKIDIKVAGGVSRKLERGATLLDLAQSLDEDWPKKALAGKIDGVLVDLTTSIPDGAEVELLDFSSAEGREVYRHTVSHIMAQAVTELYPGAKLAIGPSTETGFYYDFDLPDTLTPEDLGAIEAKMKEIIDGDSSLKREQISKAEGKQIFKQQPYKLEVIDELPDEHVTVYRQQGFVDLCRGPHLPSTGSVKAFKLLSIAGAYWRGQEDQPMLQRIYGTAFETPEELEEHLERLKEAEERDHRRLGRELDLFTINDDFGAGLPLWHPKGAMLRKVIEDFWKDEHLKQGYELVSTPHLARVELWRTSGHLDFYHEYMFSPMAVEQQEYVVKPMNCPGHMLIYRSRTRSYRDLPMRWAELGTVYRFERSGVLHGLLRVRGFTQDDAHIFCRHDQLEGEITGIIDLVLSILGTLGFSEYEIYISTRPEKFVGTQEHWDMATVALERALDLKNLTYDVDPGEGVFYGPKIDLKIRDALGRAWQCTTIQVDFNLPERFDLTYVGSDNKDHRPIMIHRAILGSLERFVGCLIEHYGGAFPLWLAPVQVVVVPIADRHQAYGQEVLGRLREAGARVELDGRSESVNRKIRDAQLQKVPFMLVVGDREVGDQTVSVRERPGIDRGAVALPDFVAEFVDKVTSKG